jgi:phosphoglycerate dehydrogenase-like enzyme
MIGFLYIMQYRTFRLAKRSSNQVRQSSSQNLKQRRIGVIGLGNVGNALVKNLQRTGYMQKYILQYEYCTRKPKKKLSSYMLLYL